MNSQSLVSEPKTTKYDEHGHVRSLNDFHDSILKHVLSFLPTKYAVQTSVLCRRWEFMWTFLPSLDFNDNDTTERKQQFMNFVDRLLHLNGTSRIQKFSLSCNVEDDDDSRIKTWISTAVSRNTKEFDLVLHGTANVNVFPRCLFNCEAIEILKIVTDLAVNLPSQICLPRLRILKLEYLTFNDCNLTNVLFSSPALEQLDINNCRWSEGSFHLVISAPKLLSLTIHESNEVFRTAESINAMSLNSVTISAPALETFCYSGGFIKTYHFCNSSSIFCALIRFCKFTCIKEVQMDHLNEVLRSLRSVEYLLLPMAVLSHVTVPILKNVISLAIPEGPIDLCCEELEMIISKCPCLETLMFFQGISEACDFLRLSNSKLTFSLSTLKQIVIGKFTGTKNELCALQMLLANATLLESMEIWFARELEEKGNRNFDVRDPLEFQILRTHLLKADIVWC